MPAVRIPNWRPRRRLRPQRLIPFWRLHPSAAASWNHPYRHTCPPRSFLQAPIGQQFWTLTVSSQNKKKVGYGWFRKNDLLFVPSKPTCFCSQFAVGLTTQKCPKGLGGISTFHACTASQCGTLGGSRTCGNLDVHIFFQLFSMGFSIQFWTILNQHFEPTFWTNICCIVKMNQIWSNSFCGSIHLQWFWHKANASATLVMNGPPVCVKILKKSPRPSWKWHWKHSMLMVVWWYVAMWYMVVHSIVNAGALKQHHFGLISACALGNSGARNFSPRCLMDLVFALKSAPGMGIPDSERFLGQELGISLQSLQYTNVYNII